MNKLLKVCQTWSLFCQLFLFNSQFQVLPSYQHMIFTYFQLINICYPYEFVDILMIEILKVVEKFKSY